MSRFQGLAAEVQGKALNSQSGTGGEDCLPLLGGPSYL